MNLVRIRSHRADSRYTCISSAILVIIYLINGISDWLLVLILKRVIIACGDTRVIVVSVGLQMNSIIVRSFLGFVMNVLVIASHSGDGSFSSLQQSGYLFSKSKDKNCN